MAEDVEERRSFSSSRKKRELIRETALDRVTEQRIASAPAVELCDITTYPKGSDSPILKNLSIILEPGRLTAIIGPSGAGKVLT
jgi:ABC-type multidrug transport system fused ATPase/permease subunit